MDQGNYSLAFYIGVAKKKTNIYLIIVRKMYYY